MTNREIVEMERARFFREWVVSDPSIGSRSVKLCPFCGSPDVNDTEGYGDSRAWGYVVCNNCGARGPAVRCMDPIEAWNIRR